MSRNKFNARKAKIGDLTFDSASEAKRWAELKILERAGEISELTRQRAYPLWVNGETIATYKPDFRYLTKDGAVCIEEHKGYWTPEAKLKVKLFEAIYRTKVLITGAKRAA